MNTFKTVISKNSVIYAAILLGFINFQTARTPLVLPNEHNLWSALSQDFTIPAHSKKAAVQQQVTKDLRDPSYIHTLTKNARPYVYQIAQEAKKLNVPVELALLPMVESSYLPSGTSRVGAAGLWQLMPSVADQYGVKMNAWYDGRRSVTASTKAALTLLASLYKQFNDNWPLALAAYNAGPGTVMNAIHYNEKHGKPTDFWSLKLPKETEEYVPKLLALAAIIQHPHKYDVTLAVVPNKPVTKTVKIDKKIPLDTIAKMANVSVSTVKKLNPYLKQHATPPHQMVTLMLPVTHKSIFVKQLQAQTEV